MKTSRHVLSTTFTTIGGFVPLLIGGGDFWPPLAIVIAGGVGGASILALYFVPASYILVRRFVEPESAREPGIEHLLSLGRVEPKRGAIRITTSSTLLW